ncbi:MAG TPA: hypothetical protein VIM16_04975 [Mucilaginibacter sp.]|jgi:cytochrome c553
MGFANMRDLISLKKAFDNLNKIASSTDLKEMTMDDINNEIKAHRLEKRTDKLSDKYKGVLSKEDGQKLNEHIKQMRSEWE